jgi:carbon storage regulator
MLVMTRKEGEKIYIGENVCVTVVRIQGGAVRIGIEAASELPIMRGELRDRLNQPSGAETPRESPHLPRD